jgi:hypothetical protein
MEWTAGGARPGSRQSIHLQGGAPTASEIREGVKEKVLHNFLLLCTCQFTNGYLRCVFSVQQIILDLSLSNERLEVRGSLASFQEGMPPKCVSANLQRREAVCAGRSGRTPG